MREPISGPCSDACRGSPWSGACRAFCFFVFFDIGRTSATSSGAYSSGPGEQVVGGPRVDRPARAARRLGGPVAAVGLPLELAGGVGVGVDREQAAVVDGDVEQLLGRVEPLGPAVDLDRGVELRAGGEHVVGVEHRRRALADQPPGAVAEDVDVRAGHGQHHALGHLLARPCAASSARWPRRRRAGRAGRRRGRGRRPRGCRPPCRSGSGTGPARSLSAATSSSWLQQTLAVRARGRW